MVVAMVQGLLPLAGAVVGIPGWMAVARPAAAAQLLLLLTAILLLGSAFVSNDFSVLYVASNSNSLLPTVYRIAALWGGHEGSLLLWATLLALWTAAVAYSSGRLPPEMVARVVGILGLVSTGFLLFLTLTSNPFERLDPAPLDGRDLNPLLQDPGLVIHPPMLYMGYVGFSVAFAFALAALLSGRLDPTWARWSRPWTAIAWVFLTLGIALGSWWAYYELGWGGWWFWDPVENASFMPWLVGTALLHSLAASEKRGVFKSWTVLLAIFSFSLSLLGTFLVRSGVLTSVHAFANDPERGLFILILLAVVVGASLTVYAIKAPGVKSSGSFGLFSRETLLLGNNLFLTVAAATILLGTLYPLIVDALKLGKISVGPPYFNTVFVPLMVPVALGMAIGPLVRWRQDTGQRLLPSLAVISGVALLSGLLLPWWAYGRLEPAVVLGVALTAFIVLSIGLDLKLRGGRGGRSFFGMHLAHLGMAAAILGVTLTSHFSTERDIRLAPGESAEIGPYRFTFGGVEPRNGPNYQANVGVVRITHGEQPVAELLAEKRIYTVTSMPMTEAAIDWGLTRDLYVALGEPLGQGGAWALRLYYKPFVRFIWLGGVLMALGGLVAVTDRRYRLGGRKEVVA